SSVQRLNSWFCPAARRCGCSTCVSSRIGARRRLLRVVGCNSSLSVRTDLGRETRSNCICGNLCHLPVLLQSLCPQRIMLCFLLLILFGDKALPRLSGRGEHLGF